MNAERDVLRCAGLRFFGTISASVTHEVKNALAIVRELSGLLSDLGAAAERGKELPLERIRDLTERIATQVSRADAVVRRMNAFSHNVDRTRVARDVREIVTGLVGLCRRFADMRRVEIETRLPDEPLSVETDPFLVQHALFLPLRRALDTAGEGGRVIVEAGAEADGARISISGGTPGPGEGEAAVLGMLHGLLGAAGAGAVEGEYSFVLPARMPERKEESHE